MNQYLIFQYKYLKILSKISKCLRYHLIKVVFAVQGVCFSFWLEKDTQAHHSLRAEEEAACCGGSQLTRLGNQYRLIYPLLPG